MTAELDKTNLRATAGRVFQYMISEHPADTDQVVGVDVDPVSWGLNINRWDWNPGVGLNSILAYYHDSHNPAALEYLVGWVQRNKHLARKFQHVNVMTPFAIFPDLYRLTGDAFYRETALDYSDWIIKNLVRTMTGAFQHGGEHQHLEQLP